MTSLGLQAIQKYLQKQVGFNRVLKKISIVNAENGKALAELKVEKEHTNPFNTLHGGLITTLVDTMSVLAFNTQTNCRLVSVNINVKFHNPARLGDTVLIEARTVRGGKTMCFLECTLTNKNSGQIVATGEHTVFVVKSKGSDS